MDKSPFRKRLAFAGSCTVALLLVGCLCLISVVLTSRNRLSVIGRRIADASNLARSYDGYYWETNDTQIVLSSDGLQTLRLDDHTGSTVPVPPLLPPTIGKLTVGEVLRSYPPQRERPSPDGKWLLFGGRGTPNFAAIEKQTGRVVQWKAASKSISFFLWFPDSKQWVEFDQSRDGNTVRPIIHSLDGTDRHMAPVKEESVWPIGITSEEHVLCAQNQSHLGLWEYNLEDKRPTPKNHPIPLPANTYVDEVEGSPDGNHVAYLVQENYRSFITRLIDRILPGRNDPSDKSMTLWVSRSDGSDLHRIGYERASEAAGVQWAPDGKRLSLFLDHDFYVVPVD